MKRFLILLLSALAGGSISTACADFERADFNRYNVKDHFNERSHQYINDEFNSNHHQQLKKYLNKYKKTRKTFDLTILHINDHHSHLEADSDAELDFNGIPTGVEMGGFPRITEKINELAEGRDNVLKLHAGDAITGTLFYTLFKGKADADLMNTVCFDVFALGNHEFDEGDANLANFINYLNGNNDCYTDVVAANVIPQIGTPLRPARWQTLIKPYVIKRVNGHRIGIIGLDIANKTKNSSNPDDTTEFLDELETAKWYIKRLKRLGINKIILLTHYQYKNEIALAQQLKDVDVIVGGDSHTLLGDFESFGLNPAGPYPTEVKNKNNKKVCVVQAWQYSNVVGELNVRFDRRGNVISCEGTPHLLVGDTFTRDDVELSGQALDEVRNFISSTDNISIVKNDEKAVEILANYQAEVDVLKNEAIGNVSTNLCVERIPGQGKSSLCDVSETSALGSDISNIVALAFKEQSLEADIAIQNAGGVRIDISSGPFSVGDAYTLLPFANTLVNLTMTRQEIVQVLEEAVENAAFGGSTGAYPYASGLRWDVNLSYPFGSRISNVQIKLKGQSDWSAIALNETYTVVTNSFVAGGKDGYITFGTVSSEGRVVDTYLDYAQSFVDYVKRLTAQGKALDKLPKDEYSTQKFYDKNGLLQN
jgi:5'-nucleotidase